MCPPAAEPPTTPGSPAPKPSAEQPGASPGPVQDPVPPGGQVGGAPDSLQPPPSGRVVSDVSLEVELVRRAQVGDTRAFDELVGIYGPRVYNFISRMVGNREDARDLTQTTFLKVWRSIGRVDPERRFSCWIYRVAVNQARNAIRDRKPRTALNERMAAPGPSPEENARQAERSRTLQEALLALAEADRVLLVLRYFGQLGLDEMSRVLGTREDTIKSRLYSARRKLGRELMKRGVSAA